MSTEERDSQIEAMHKDGFRISKIAKAYHLSDDTVRRILRERDLRSGAREETGFRWAMSNWEKARLGAVEALNKMETAGR